jgi:hypothetical protein
MLRFAAHYPGASGATRTCQEPNERWASPAPLPVGRVNALIRAEPANPELTSGEQAVISQLPLSRQPPSAICTLRVAGRRVLSLSRAFSPTPTCAPIMSKPSLAEHTPAIGENRGRLRGERACAALGGDRAVCSKTEAQDAGAPVGRLPAVMIGEQRPHRPALGRVHPQPPHRGAPRNNGRERHGRPASDGGGAARLASVRELSLSLPSGRHSRHSRGSSHGRDAQLRLGARALLPCPRGAEAVSCWLQRRGRRSGWRSLMLRDADRMGRWSRSR